VPQINVYLSIGVKAAMDAVEQHRPRWSEIAQRAFAAEVARLGKLYGIEHKKKPRRRGAP
jgi:hypothetical protein